MSGVSDAATGAAAVLGGGGLIGFAKWFIGTRDICVVLTTGYDESTIPSCYASVSSFNKPVTHAMLCDALAELSSLAIRG
jgi:hypothetical protein